MSLRPSLYTAEIAEQILSELRRGRSLCDVCDHAGMPHHDTIANWVKQDREGFAARYREACQAGRDGLGERLLGELMNGRTLTDICSDPGMPNHTTISRWIATDCDGFAVRYRHARQVGHLSRAAVPYTAEIADLIVDELMSGRPLEEICSEPDMPASSSVRKWVKDDREGFKARYWEAREMGYQILGDQILQIVDDRRNDWIVRHRKDGTTEVMLDPERVSRARLRYKARRWLLSKMLPKTFGDRAEFYTQQQAQGDSDMVKMLRLIDGKTRGLPSEDEPLDDL